MSEFRDRIGHNLVSSAGHPSRAYDMLVELEIGMREKVSDSAPGQFTEGMIEMLSFVVNLRKDIAQKYGY